MKYASDAYYAAERKLYKDAYSLCVTEAEAELIARKVLKHFKCKAQPEFIFRGSRDSGWCSSSQIRFSHRPTIGTVLHELSHWLKRWRAIPAIHAIANIGTEHHGLQFDAYLNHVHLYAKDCHYWTPLLAARREKTHVKEVHAGVTPLNVQPWRGFREGSVASAVYTFVKTKGACRLDDLMLYISTRYNRDLSSVNALVMSYLVDWSRGSWAGEARSFPFTLTFTTDTVTYQER